MNINDFAGKKNSSKLTPEAKEIMKKFVSSYEGKSEAELFDTITKIAEENKKSGKLTNADIDNFSSMLSPMLSKGQKEKLKGIIDKLKD